MLKTHIKLHFALGSLDVLEGERLGFEPSALDGKPDEP